MDLQNIPAGLTCQFCHRLIWGHQGQNWKWPECFAHLEWRRS